MPEPIVIAKKLVVDKPDPEGVLNSLFDASDALDAIGVGNRSMVFSERAALACKVIANLRAQLAEAKQALANARRDLMGHCRHSRLDVDGICRICGTDRRGA